MVLIRIRERELACLEEFLKMLTVFQELRICLLVEEVTQDLELLICYTDLLDCISTGWCIVDFMLINPLRATRLRKRKVPCLR
jgi:hypothetical protein